MSGRHRPWVTLIAGVAGLALAGWGTTASAAVTTRAAAGTWETVTMPQPPTSGGHQPAGVSCPTRSFCMAVGTTSSTEGVGGAVHVQSPFAETFNGTRWTVRHPSTPASATLTALYGVSCPSPTDCTVVGATGRGNIATGLLAESWNGKTWRIEATASPGGGAAVNDFFSVSCPTASSCMAVGTTERGRTLPLAETWRSGGVGWKVVATVAPAPKGATSYSDALYSVSCPSAARCVAVGGQADQSSGGAGESNLVETWNGTAWSDTAVASSTAGSSLYGVACASAVRCIAGGQTNVDRRDDGLATSLVLAGGTWTIEPTPHVPGEHLDDLVGVSCSAPRACTGVGLQSGARTGALAEHWDGSRWTVQTTPDPGRRSALVSVACARRSRCVAVGSYESGQAAFSEIGPA
jgi:hypothetical protein